MQTHSPNGTIEAKLKVLKEIEEFLTKQTLVDSIAGIADQHEVEFKELWSWAIDEIFSEELPLVKEPSVPNVVAKPKVEAKPKVVKPKVVKPKVVKPKVVKPKVEAKPKVTKPKVVKPKVEAKPKIMRRGKDPLVNFKALDTESKIETLEQTKCSDIVGLGSRDANRYVRIQAIKNPAIHQKDLERVVAQDTNVKVRRVAIKFVTNQPFLERTLITEQDREIKVDIVQKLENRDLLGEIVKSGDYTIVKAAAQSLATLPNIT